MLAFLQFSCSKRATGEMSCVLMSTKHAKGSVGEGEKGKKAYKWTLKAFTVTSWILRQTFFIRMSQFINLVL